MAIPGLFLRCRAKPRRFILQRRVQRQLVKETIGSLPLKRARDKAMRALDRAETQTRGGRGSHARDCDQALPGRKTARAESPRRTIATTCEHLADWAARGLHDVGNDRAGFRFLIGQIKKKHGVATRNQVVRLVSAVYRWQRKIDTSLPEPPTTAVEVESIPPRDWAYSAKDLANWWYSREEKTARLRRAALRRLDRSNGCGGLPRCSPARERAASKP